MCLVPFRCAFEFHFHEQNQIVGQSRGDHRSECRTRTNQEPERPDAAPLRSSASQRTKCHTRTCSTFSAFLLVPEFYPQTVPSEGKVATVVTRPVVASSPRVAVLTARGVRARRPGPFSGSRDPSPRAPVARRRSGAPPAREVRPRTPSHDFAFGSHAMEATSHVTRPGSLPHVRVVGFEPVPSMSAPEDARKPLFAGLLGGETIAVSSPLSQMLGGSNGKSGSADGSPQSGFFSAQSSDSDRSGDVARRFDNEHAAGELSRHASMEGTSDVQHHALAVAGRETPPIDIPYARGYRHPRSQRCANAPFFVRFFTDGGLFRPNRSSRRPPHVAFPAKSAVARLRNRARAAKRARLRGPREAATGAGARARGGTPPCHASRGRGAAPRSRKGSHPVACGFWNYPGSIPKSGSIPV